MSKPLVVSVPHRLGKEEELRRLKNGLGQAGASFGHLIQHPGGKLDRQPSSVSDQRTRPNGERLNRRGRRPCAFVSISTVASGEGRRDAPAAHPQGRNVAAGEKVTQQPSNERQMPGVLITSANRGLGLEFARQYVADGWFVFAACRDPASGGDLQRLAKSAGGKLTIVAMDVTDSESVRSAARQLKDVVIDIVINSAGITGVSGQKVGKIDYDSWAHVLNVNTMGPLRVIEVLCRPHCPQRTQAGGDHHERHGLYRRQYVRWLDCLPQLQGGGKHGDAKRGYRSCAAPYHLCRGQSRVGEDRHGRPQRDVDATRKCNRLAAAYRDVRPSSFG